MIITYFRSSSWNCYNNCAQQYYLQYVLGFENRSGKKASLGNVVHKALECLAAYKLSLQNGVDSFVDDSIGVFYTKDCDPDNLIKIAYDYYKEVEHYHDWDDNKDFKDCKNWMYKALNFQNGLFDPRNRKVIIPEQRFDFEIEKPWAKYNYKLPDGVELDGYLSLKGTVDLLTEVRPGVIEMIDWKTGATRKDFSTGKDKGYIELHTDPQLRLYHYAVHHLYPDIKDILITIYYIRAGGPFSLMLSKKDLPETERMIKNHFERVKRTIKPTLNPGPEWSDRPHPKIASFKCHKLCNFSKPSRFDPSISECQFIKEQIEKNGIDKTTNKFGDLSKISAYSEGGGRRNM